MQAVFFIDRKKGNNSFFELVTFVGKTGERDNECIPHQNMLQLLHFDGRLTKARTV